MQPEPHRAVHEKRVATSSPIRMMEVSRQKDWENIVAKQNKQQSGDGAMGRVIGQPQLICLDVDRISLYDRNPRTVRNPEYDRIKQSIVAHGLEQPLIVTRRPTEDTYIVKAGGNTRLQILKELYKSTDDPCFAMANCIEVGWQDESAVLLSHLRENHLRGNLTFGDQAAAVCAYGEMLAEEEGESRVSLARLEAALRDNGLPISHGSLSRMRFAAEFLMPVMPVALSDGLGHRQVGKISKLRHSARRLWVRTGTGSKEEFDAVFAELCRRNDGPDWQFETLRLAVETEIAEAGDVSVQTVRMAFDALDFSAMPPPQRETLIAVLSAGESNEATARTTDQDPTGEDRSPADGPAGNDLLISVELDDDEQDDRRVAAAPSDCPFVELRQRAYGLAKSLAMSFQLGNLVTPLPDCGNGFLLADLPDSKLLKMSDTGARAMIGTVWWQLLAFSETACAPPELIRDRLPDGSSLREVVEERNVELLFERVDIINAPHFADRFWARLPKQEWQNWLYLAHTHRELRRTVIETEQPLWAMPT